MWPMISNKLLHWPFSWNLTLDRTVIWHSMHADLWSMMTATIQRICSNIILIKKSGKECSKNWMQVEREIHITFCILKDSIGFCYYKPLILDFWFSIPNLQTCQSSWRLFSNFTGLGNLSLCCNNCQKRFKKSSLYPHS